MESWGENKQEHFSYTSPELQRKNALSLLIFEAIIIIVITSVVLFTLTYLGILPAQKIIPFFTSLPQKIVSIENKVRGVAPTPETAQNTNLLPFISCPVDSLDCANGYFVTYENNINEKYGFKFKKINSGKLLFAAISGKIMKNDTNSITILDELRGIKVRYVWTGQIKMKDALDIDSKVTEKQTIGNFSGQDNSLTIYATATITGKSIMLGVEKNGYYLTSMSNM